MDHILIDENYPDIYFYTQDGYNVCEYNGDIITTGAIEIDIPFEIAAVFVCTGRMQAGECVRSNNALVAQKGITAGTFVECFNAIHCCSGGIRAQSFIRAAGRIDLRGDLIADSYIDCEGIGCVDGDICAGGCIIAKTDICTTEDIMCWKRIFAGVQMSKEAKEESYQIACTKLLRGEVCRGVLIENSEWQPEGGWC